MNGVCCIQCPSEIYCKKIAVSQQNRKMTFVKGFPWRILQKWLKDLVGKVISIILHKHFHTSDAWRNGWKLQTFCCEQSQPPICTLQQGSSLFATTLWCLEMITNLTLPCELFAKDSDSWITKGLDETFGGTRFLWNLWWRVLFTLWAITIPIEFVKTFQTSQPAKYVFHMHVYRTINQIFYQTFGSRWDPHKPWSRMHDIDRSCTSTFIACSRRLSSCFQRNLWGFLGRNVERKRKDVIVSLQEFCN